jgi:hypothetical protein
MRKHLFIAVATVAAMFAIAGTASAAGNGATVVKDAGCTTNVFGTTCTVVKTTTNTTTTPSGKTSYVTNGTVERTITFVFGGTYTFSDSLHSHALLANGEFQVTSDHYASEWESVSGTYHLVCWQSYDIHWTNDDAQFGNSELGCEVV